jgi:hypothetical protein
MTRDVVVSTATLVLNITVAVLLVLNYRVTNERIEVTNALMRETAALAQAAHEQAVQLEATRAQLRCIHDE